MFTRNTIRTGATITTLVAALALAGCSETTSSGPTPRPEPAVQLKDVVISSLPSPFYHFEYDDVGRINNVSYASGFTMYDVSYDRDRISQLHNNTIANRDRLDYLIGVFGEDRIFFGIDFPNSDGVAPIDKIVGVVKQYFAATPRSLQERYFWKNSIAAYHWVKREGRQPSL